VPMVFMFGVSTWALGAILLAAVRSGDLIRLVASGFLLTLAAALIVLTISKSRREEVS